MKRKIEVFSAGCSLCNDAIALLKRIACSSCEIEVLDMRDQAAAERARNYEIKRVPAIVINGKVADCCQEQEVTESVLRAAGVGQA